MKELAEQKKAEASLAKARKDLEIAKKNRSPEFIGDGRRNELLRAAELSYNSALKAYEKSTNTLRATEDRIQVAENTFKKVSKITAAVNFYRPEDDDTKNASKPSVRIKKERTTETKGPVQIVVDDTLIQLLVRSLEGDHVGGIRRDHAMWDSALQQETVAAVASSSSPELTVSKTRIPSKTEKFLFGKTAETQDGEERLIADVEAQRVQRQRAAFVDHRGGEEIGRAGVARARGDAGEDLRVDTECRQLRQTFLPGNVCQISLRRGAESGEIVAHEPIAHVGTEEPSAELLIAGQDVARVERGQLFGVLEGIARGLDGIHLRHLVVAGDDTLAVLDPQDLRVAGEAFIEPDVLPA